MKKSAVSLLMVVCAASISIAEELDLFILAGQSNAQGFQGDAMHYPQDPDELDKTIRFYWVTPGHSSSEGKWTTLKAQGGRFEKGHFGPEVTFARSLKMAGYNPVIFKYSRGSSSLRTDWKGPGDGRMYDQMVKEFGSALALLKKKGHHVNIRGLIWIQGESDAQTLERAKAYKGRLKTLIDDLRKNVTQKPDLLVVLGVDEQHSWVRSNPQVVQAQQALAEEDEHIVFTTMMGLEKADSTHLTPKGLEEHGRRIYTAYTNRVSGQQENAPDKK